MFDDKFQQLIRGIYSARVVVFANYKAKESLYAKGITPAIFLHQFYQKKGQHNLEVFYFIKEKGCKPLCDVTTIDSEEYNSFKEEVYNKIIKQKVLNSQFKQPKHITRDDLQNRASIENHLNNINFHWFEEGCKILMHAMALDEDNHKYSTLEQPYGLVFMIEIDQHPVKEHYQKLKKQAQLKFSKMFSINPLKTRYIPIMVVLLYDFGKKITYHDAKNYADWIRQQYKLDQNQICKIEINGEKSQDSLLWSNYSKPILHQPYKLNPSDPIRLLDANQYYKMKQFTNTHRQRIRKAIQQRLIYLSMRYQENNRAKNIFLNFFNRTGSTVQKSYNQEEAQIRQLADTMFMLQDYKRAYELYKSICQKFASQRDQAIGYNVKQMIQWCLVLSKFHGIRLRSNPLQSIQKHADRFLFRKAVSLGKNKLHRYMIFLLYAFHGFKTFHRQFIKVNYYFFIKKIVSEQTYNQPNSSIIPTLIHQQYANLNLLFPTPEHRRYCYDLIRVGSKFNQFKLYGHYLRCLQIADHIYQDSFPHIQRFMNLTLSRTYLQLKNYAESLKKLKKTWRGLINCNDYSITNPNDVEDSEFVKMSLNHQKTIAQMSLNHQKIIAQIQKVSAQQLWMQQECSIPLPTINNISIDLVDESLDSMQKFGSKWQDVGDIFLEKPQLISKGMNKQHIIKLFYMFDSVSAQEKQLAYRIKKLHQITQAIAKKNSRVSYVGQPIKINFIIKNPLPNTIQITNIKLHVKDENSCSIIHKQKQKGNGGYIIRPFQIQNVQFEVIPKIASLLQFSHISWVFLKVKSIHKFKEPKEMMSNLKSFYYKLNVIEKAGMLKVKMNYQTQLYEGQLTQIQVIFKNEGYQTIYQIYLAVDSEYMFDFKLTRFDFYIQPKQQYRDLIKIKIPMFGVKIKSNYWKFLNKCIFLYRTGSAFRLFRLVNTFNIYRIAQIFSVVCQRLSKSLHLLSFSIKYENPEKQKLKILKSMIICSGLQIKKVETNYFGLSTIQYFFFLRKNYGKELYQYKFSGDNVSCLKLISDNLVGVTEQNKIKLIFVWRDNINNVGMIDIGPLSITATQNTVSKVQLPFSFKIKIQNEISFNFEQNVFLQLDVEISIKNIFDPKEINMYINLIQIPNNDFCWEGITQKVVSLKYNDQINLKIKMLIFRSGIYDIARNIQYVISLNKANSYSLNHHQYENIYLTVNDQNLNDPNQNFDFFDELGSGASKLQKNESFQNFDLL